MMAGIMSWKFIKASQISNYVTHASGKRCFAAIDISLMSDDIVSLLSIQ